jgi:hypothetical protein
VGTPHSSSPSSVSSSQQRSLAASISVSLPKRPFGAPASETTSTGHAFQTYQLINGRPGWTAGVRIKGGYFSEPGSFIIERIKGGYFSEPGSFIIEHSSLFKLTHQSSQLPDLSRRRKLRPTARPRCLMDRALHHPAAHAKCQHSTAAHPTKWGTAHI